MKQKIRPILSVPDALVTKSKFNFGTYRKPFMNVNPHDSGSGFFRKFRLKEWQHFALVNREFYITLVLFNAKKMAFVQVCIYDRTQKKFFFREKKAAPWTVILPMTLFRDRASCCKEGFKLTIYNELDMGRHRIEFSVTETATFPSAEGCFTLYEDLNNSEPVVVCLPLKNNDAMYSHKFISPMEGSVNLGGKEHSFLKSDSYGLIDVHKGYYPYVMKWHWGTGGGFIGENLVGFNLTDNQVEDQERFNENCIWTGGRLHLLPPVKFTFDKHDRMKPWMIKDRWGLVDLVFIPEGIRKVDMNALVVKNTYRAPYGMFHGKIGTAGGDEYVIENFFGMCEDMYLRS